MGNKKHKPATYYEAAENLRSELRGLGNAILDAGLGRVFEVVENIMLRCITFLKAKKGKN
jgi:hypothetical protein